MEREYHDGDTIYILMSWDKCSALMDDWLAKNWGCDLVVKRSQKNKGCCVVVTKDLIWANRIMRWHEYKRVTFK